MFTRLRAVAAALVALAFATLAPANACADSGASALSARELAVVVNDADPLSVAIARYYQQRRSIPQENLVHVTLDSTRATVSVREFETANASVKAQLAPHIQALALTWIRPYRVDCMSMTTAFAAGFDPAFCSTRCTTTRWSPYFNANSHHPYDDFRWRPTMSIAATDLPQARALIDRGVAADGVMPRGTAYLVSTSDMHRNVRARTYPDAALMVSSVMPVQILATQQIEQKQDVMFYFTGLARVGGIATNRFLPGAIADHLTSFGGDLDGTQQMSSLRWLEGGATGSYGTVNEPCNLPGKFPNPGMVMRRYLAGETLIEAYWKSVAMPGQGLFIGEPLARPYGRGRNLADDGSSPERHRNTLSSRTDDVAGP